MFTKEDYKEYFLSIKDKEEGMVSYLQKIKRLLQDKDTIAVVDDVLRDEVEHVILSKKLFEYL